MSATDINYLRLVELAEDLIYSAGLDGQFRYANPAALAMVGVSSDAISEHHFLDFVREDYRETVDTFYKAQVEHLKDSTYLEFPAVTADGNSVWLGQRVRLDWVEGELAGVVVVARDISDRRTAEVERNESIEKYQNLFDHSSDAILVHNLAGDIVDANHRASSLLGWEKEELTGMNIRSLHPESALEDSESAFAQVISDGYARFETQFRRSDGTVFSADISASQVSSSEETTVLGVIRDVTEQQEAMSRIVELTNLYEQILNAIPLQIALFDREARYEYVSPSGIADAEVREWILGKTNEEYCAQRGLATDVGQRRTDRIRGVLEAGERLEMNESFADRTGVQRHFMRYLDPIRDTSGAVTKALGWGIDITDLKNVEKALKESEARKSAVLETALDCIISIDSEGRVLEFNPAAEATFGWTRDEMVGVEMADRIIPEHYREPHRQGMRTYLKTGQGPVLGQRIEITAIRKSGEEFPVELAIQPIETGDTPVFTAYLRDISEPKKAEAELAEANRRATESAEAKQQFLANMSHEMRTPLNAVIGMTHLLQDTPLDATQSRFVSTIQFASDNLLALISDLLDYAKISAGKVVFEAVSFSLNELLEGLENTFSYRAQEKGLAFQVTREETLPDRITGDPVRLSQILLNLISNAIKFTVEGGVTVRVRRDGGSDEEVELVFDVLDTGVGIEEADLGHIFESFNQAGASTTRQFGGTGLGLAIAKELVDRQGGVIEVDSALGTGSRFSVFLPFAVSAGQDLHADAPARMPTGDGLRGKRVLVAEDNEINQFVVCSMLQRWGAKTEVAHNGVEAVEHVRLGDYDLVLMDIQMPEMDGHDACLAIRQELGVSATKLPIIALTASTAPDERDRLMRAGMQDFVLKPFEPGALYDRLLLHLKIEQAAGGSAAIVEESVDDAGSNLFSRLRFETTTMGNPALGVRLINVYLRDADRQVADFDSLVGSGDWEGLGQLAHRLKSSAGSLGLVALQGCWLDLEGQARSAQEQIDPASISSTRDIMRRSLELLTRLKSRLENG